MKKTILGATFISIAAILWGLDGVILTPRLFNLDVSIVVFMLHIIPFVLMNFFLYNEYKKIKQFNKSDIIYLSLIAIFGGAIGTLAIVKALFLVNFDHLSIVILLQKLQPIFAIILARILLKEKLKKRFLEWATVAIVGSYFLAFGLHLPSFQGNNMAIAYSLLAAFSFGSATVFGKKVLKKYPFKTVTFYRFGLTALFMGIWVTILNKYSLFSNITPTNWLIFFIIAITTGSGAILLYYYGLNRIKASVATICELFFPISTILFDYLINKNTLTLVQWISIIVMITAIIKISNQKN